MMRTTLFGAVLYGLILVAAVMLTFAQPIPHLITARAVIAVAGCAIAWAMLQPVIRLLATTTPNGACVLSW